MGYYCGIDLHSNNNYIGIIDESGKKIYKSKNDNNLRTILKSLNPFKEKIKGVVIESTFNWYWLVDGLMSSKYKVHLANTTAIQQYSGLKYTDDNSDTLWLAEMLRLKILPEGYIHPPKERAVRDLLRRRMQLVQHRTAFYLSMKGMINNCTGIVIPRKDLKSLGKKDVDEIFSNPHQVMSADSICTVTNSLTEEIKKIEKAVIKEVRLKKGYKKLLTVHGIGEILGITIMLETGDINRFSDVGDYGSYCRNVPSSKKSNGKNKGSGNKKNGNRYLAWAYVEAANFMPRFNLQAKVWYQKKASKRGNVLAIKALASKISRACYYVMKNHEAFDPKKLFGFKKGGTGNR